MAGLPVDVGVAVHAVDDVIIHHKRGVCHAGQEHCHNSRHHNNTTTHHRRPLSLSLSLSYGW